MAGDLAILQSEPRLCHTGCSLGGARGERQRWPREPHISGAGHWGQRPRQGRNEHAGVRRQLGSHVLWVAMTLGP